MEANNLVLNKLFTQNTFHELINNNKNTTYGTIVQRYVADSTGKNNSELICEIYSFISKSYRNEYYYQNTLFNKMLLGRHNVNSTTALTQIPIGKSKADFILINGKATVYEIKSELDSFDRLDSQLKDYYKAFNHVCVVTAESCFNRLNNILRNTPVGICVLTKNDTISRLLKKEALEDNKNLDHLSIFKVLHKNEFEAIIKKHFGRLPISTQVFYYDECFAMFSQIPLMKAYTMSIKELKKRNHIVQNLLNEIPYELRSLVYFSNPSPKDLFKLSGFLNNKFGR
jgi:hypothetical protein